MKKEYISPYVIKRLPRYYRFLGDLIDEGKIKTSSSELAERLGMTASQIRQDLNCFGEFGQQGYGYNVRLLRKEIGEIIGIQHLNKAIIIGAGNVGTALCDENSFGKRGCSLIGIFDNANALMNKQKGEHKVQSINLLPDFCEKHKPDIAVICVPKMSVRPVCERLIQCGVTNFWNFTHFDIKSHFENVNVEDVHLGDSLLTLVYNLNRLRNLGKAALVAEAEVAED
jgi:redox-sensing transcriptional repressor